MADDEEYTDEEVEEEEEEQQAEKIRAASPAKQETQYAPDEPTEEPKQLKRTQKVVKEEAPREMTEAELAMQEAKQRQEEEALVRMREYEERRKEEKEALEEELTMLRARRDERQRERREMEEQLAEAARKAQEARRQEEAEMLARREATKLKQEQQKKKRQAKLTGYIAGGNTEEGAQPNYVVNKKSEEMGSAGSGVQKKATVADLEQKAEAKKSFLAALMRRKMDPSALLDNDLRNQIVNMHKHISKLQAEKYDLEKRHDNQEYDLKELHEREKQAARHRAIKKGLDPNEAVESCHPPKIYVASKHDRQVDSRSYGDRRCLYEPRPPKPKKVARGTPRPPPDWGRCGNEELEVLRRNLGPPKYIELAPVDAKPPVPYKPLQLPKEDEVEEEEEHIIEKEPVREKVNRNKEATKTLLLAQPEEEDITEGQDTSGVFTIKLAG